MIKLLLSRLLYGLLVMAGVVLIVFALFNLLPADPASLTLGQRADVASIEAINKELGLDRPKHIQLWMYLSDISPISIEDKSPEARGKYNYLKLLSISSERAIVLKKPYLRRSYQSKKPVWDILMEALPQTILLAFAAIIIACLTGIPLGVVAAVKQHSFFDRIVMFVSVLGISLPSYFSAMVLGYLFGIVWHAYTGLDHVGALFVLDDECREVFVLKNLILPALALGSRPVAIVFQLTRSSMLDVLSQDYIRTAQAKGVSFFQVLYKHALRNAMNPVVTAVSGWFAGLLAGAFFVEVIFGINGLGYVAVDALLKFDFPVAAGTLMFTAMIFVVINILADILYAVLDPRIKLTE